MPKTIITTFNWSKYSMITKHIKTRQQKNFHFMKNTIKWGICFLNTFRKVSKIFPFWNVLSHMNSWKCVGNKSRLVTNYLFHFASIYMLSSFYVCGSTKFFSYTTTECTKVPYSSFSDWYRGTVLRWHGPNRAQAKHHGRHRFG